VLLGALQENLVTLLTYDRDRAAIIRGLVDPALFGGPYREIVASIYHYIDRYKRPPAHHLPDLFSHILEGVDQHKASIYADIFDSIHQAHKETNAEYVMGQLEVFIKRQSLRTVAIDLAKALQRDTEASLAEAEQLIAGVTQAHLSVFDPGTRLSDKKRALSFLDLQQAALPTGIPELDKRGLGPTRKELFLYIANTKAGKTWFLIHLAKIALMHRFKVLHITLEMSEARCSQRYMQTFFAMAKRKEKLTTTKSVRDNLGRITDYEAYSLEPKVAMDSPNIRRQLERRIDRASARFLDNIIIKQFPTGSLTIPELNAYMDNLEATQHFTPDLMVLDYPDLMKIDKNNARLSIDEIYKDVRGVLVRRNIAGAVVSQSHRQAVKARVVGPENVAEAYSKIAHADTIITYTQTAQERQLGLARLHVAGGRNDQDNITIVISQQYGVGTFVIDSNRMIGNYWGIIPHELSEG